MAEARLEVTDALGTRVAVVDRYPFTIGRREGNHLRLSSYEVSRDHADIVESAGNHVLRDRGSRYGTFVKDVPVTEYVLVHGDRIRLGREGGVEMVFLAEPVSAVAHRVPDTGAVIGDLGQIAVLLERLRALGSDRVLDDVLALVMDAAIAVSGAERGFIMLAGQDGALDFKLGRSRGRVTLPGQTFKTSRKIPEEVFATGEARMVADLLDADLADVHMGTVALGIRHVLCVPLRLVRYLERVEAEPVDRRIGVLYLDSRERGSLLSNVTRSALETLATEAAVAIENARLYREALEKAKLDHELGVAAEIQQALLPKGTHASAYFDAAAATIPSRSIGGDFFDYVDLQDGSLGFSVGDVAGKGAPAALLSAMLQGILLAQATSAETPAATITRVNQSLIRRAIEARFVTLFYGTLSPDGRLTYCNAGHNPPLVIGAHGVRRLEVGGPVLGLFDHVGFEEERVRLERVDLVVVFSDGIIEALNSSGEEFGEARIVEAINTAANESADEALQCLFASVGAFTTGAAQGDDMTAMVVRYEGIS